ncbi:hypothetical protein BDZ89DRAFT_1038846 [Hymenopellis radicata]|nr:hypothetical protein BDZ89DRAFT_1038846 [Hymenopellis radicata]
MAVIAFIHTIIITLVLFLFLVSAWAVVKVYKAMIRNAQFKEDEESFIFKPSVWEPKYLSTALFFSQKAAFASPAPTIESPLPPLNPGATHSHPCLPPNIPASQDAEVSVPSTAFVHSEDSSPPQASSQVNPALSLTPDYYRFFTNPMKTTTSRLTERVIDEENLAPPPAASKRKSSRRVREQQLKEYIPPAYLLAQRCIDIVHSRSARHAAEDELRYGAPQKF